MPPKKGFEAFLKKNQKKGSKAGKTDEVSEAQVSEVNADQKEKKSDVVKNTTVTKKQNNNSSDDEEVDELELATKQQIIYGTVKENRDIAVVKDKNDELVGYGLDEAKEEKKTTDKQPVKKAVFGEGASFGRPTFGGRKKVGDKFGGGDFSAGLDDIDNPQASKKDSHKAPAEESKPESKGPVKPTFRGRMNLTGGPGANDNNSGVKTDYDFGVVYSTKRVEGEEGEKREGDAKRGENQMHTKARKPRDYGTEFGKEKKEESDEDNNFTIVRDTTKRVKKTRQADSDSDEETESRGRGGFRGGFRGSDDGGFRGSRVSRGGERGGFERERGGFGGERAERGSFGGDRGGERRGGFFKNSSKRTE